VGIVKVNVPTRLLLFVSAVAITALAVVAVTFGQFPVQATSVTILLIFAQIASELLPVRLPAGTTISVSYPVEAAALVLAGPAAAVLNAGIGSLAHDLRLGKSPLKVIYNLAQDTLSTALAGWIAVLVGANIGIDFPLGSLLGRTHYPAILAPMAVFVAVGVVLNSILVGAVVTVSERGNLAGVLREGLTWHTPIDFALGLLGVALAQAVASQGWFGLVLLVVPLVVSRGVFQSYVYLREVYADTLRGLIAAIEAKDPYTRGHSERVSEYATALAREMRLQPAQMESLEFAALLHDLGKIGVKGKILRKKGKLTEEEFGSIRMHPDIGAEIIESVSFLRGSVPAILHHHERFDGKGYQSGLVGESIPLEARILAVVDSYDAMISRRPYRSALSSEDAREELRRASGTQFDPRVVSVFMSMSDVFSSVRKNAVESGIQ